MTSRHRLFRVLYRLGFTPWDGHPLAKSLRQLIEGDGALQPLTPGTALDVGCGTGDTSIYLAQHGWQVTGVDFVPKAIEKARAKARTAGVTVEFRQADATRLADEGVGGGFGLIVDNGCLHGMSDGDRASYVREITAVAAADTRLLLVEFTPGTTRMVPGIGQAEIQRRFTPDWTLLTTGDEPGMSGDGRFQARHYVLARSQT